MYALSKPFCCGWPIEALTAHQPIQLPHAPHLRTVKVNINLILQTFYLGIFVVNTCLLSTEQSMLHSNSLVKFLCIIIVTCEISWESTMIMFFLCRKKILQKLYSHITHQHPHTLYSSDVMHAVHLRLMALRLQCVYHYCVYLPVEQHTGNILWFKTIKLNLYTSFGISMFTIKLCADFEDLPTVPVTYHTCS